MQISSRKLARCFMIIIRMILNTHNLFLYPRTNKKEVFWGSFTFFSSFHCKTIKKNEKIKKKENVNGWTNNRIKKIEEKKELLILGR